MIQSMTGYGKAEATIQSGKLTLEIRTLNAKSADISIKDCARMSLMISFVWLDRLFSSTLHRFGSNSISL